MQSISRAIPIVLFGLLSLNTACSSSSPSGTRDGGPGGAAGGGAAGHATSGGSGGRSSTGAGTSTGGSAGSGGRSNTGGGTSTGGNAGSGGRSSAGSSSGGTSTGAGGTGAAGTTGSGGQQTGGSGGNPKLDAGGGDLGAGSDATVEVGQPDASSDLRPNPDSSGGAMTLEACFADLPKPVGLQMVATKQSSDSRVRVRIALDTEDRMGTSGSYGWGLIRLAVELDGEVTCIKDRASLKYTGSHHNCSDSASATSGSTTYKLSGPDRGSASLTITSNGASKGDWTLTDTACAMADSSRVLPGECRSGGPC